VISRSITMFSHRFPACVSLFCLFLISVGIVFFAQYNSGSLKCVQMIRLETLQQMIRLETKGAVVPCAVPMKSEFFERNRK